MGLFCLLVLRPVSGFVWSFFKSQKFGFPFFTFTLCLRWFPLPFMEEYITSAFFSPFRRRIIYPNTLFEILRVDSTSVSRHTNVSFCLGRAPLPCSIKGKSLINICLCFLDHPFHLHLRLLLLRLTIRLNLTPSNRLPTKLPDLQKPFHKVQILRLLYHKRPTVKSMCTGIDFWYPCTFSFRTLTLVE